MDSLDLLITYTKINSKWVKELNVRPETIKLIEENIGRTLYDINRSKILYDPPPRVMKIKTKINKWDLIKLKSCLVSNQSILKEISPEYSLEGLMLKLKLQYFGHLM